MLTAISNRSLLEKVVEDRALAATNPPEIAAALLPKPKKNAPRETWWDFPLIGFVAGTAALTIGAIGPILAPVFARRGFVKERLVATKAVCQTIMHLSKIPAFIWIRDIDVQRLGLMTLMMMAMVIPGTLVGKSLLKRVSDTQFTRLYRVTLLIAGLKVFFYDGLRPLLTT